MAAGCRARRIAALGAACVALTTGVAAAAHSRPGSLETGYGHRGIATLGARTRLFGIAVQPGGDAVAVGETGVGRSARLLLARFTPSGQLDRKFGHRGLVVGPAVRNSRGSGSLGRAVALAPGGKIVVVGKATSADGSARDGLLVERYDANGSLDRKFGSHGVVNLLSSSFGDGYAVAVQSNGRIVATGSDDAAGSGNGVYPRVAVVRLTPNGSLDRGFASHGIDVLDLGPFSSALAVALDRGGKIVIAGSQSPGLQATNGLVARLTSSGRLDHTFARTGFVAHQYAQGAAFSAFNGVAVRSNGQIVAAGAATASGEQADTVVARFNASGSPDRSFGSGGVAYARSATGYLAGTAAVPGATGLVITPGGGVLAAGQARTGVISSLAVWDFTASGHAAGGFGSHGEARLGGTEQTEGAAIALAANGAALVAGDENQLTGSGSYAGLVARYAS